MFKTLSPDLKVPDSALPALISNVVPTGLSGLMIAAIIASLMSTADSALNSWSTLFTFDFYHRLIDRRADSKKLIFVGRLTTVFVLIVAVIRAPLLRESESIVQFLFNSIAYITAPIIVIFIVGIFWRKATSAAAVTTMILSPIICYFAQHMRFYTGWGPEQTSIVYWLPIAAAILCTIMIILSFFTKHKDSALISGLIWSRANTLEIGSDLMKRLDKNNSDKESNILVYKHFPIWKDYRLIGAIAVILMIVLIYILR